MRGESMKGKSKKSTYSTTFGVDPIKKKKPQVIELTAFKMVGVAELESATPCVSCKCSNQLSYTPAVLF